MHGILLDICVITHCWVTQYYTLHFCWLHITLSQYLIALEYMIHGRSHNCGYNLWVHDIKGNLFWHLEFLHVKHCTSSTKVKVNLLLCMTKCMLLYSFLISTLNWSAQLLLCSTLMTSAERALGSNAATESLLQKTNQFILGLSEHVVSNHNDHAKEKLQNLKNNF